MSDLDFCKARLEVDHFCFGAVGFLSIPASPKVGLATSCSFKTDFSSGYSPSVVPHKLMVSVFLSLAERLRWLALDLRPAADARK